MEMQRRQFIQGAAALGAGALVASLTGCATGPSTSMSDTGTDTATSGGAEIPQGFAAEDFEESAVILEPITDFVKEHTYDIVVVGAGTAGLPAVLTALEEGATVACLQKESTAISQGCAGAGACLQESTELGIKRFMSTYAELCEYRVNYELLKTYVEHSGETIMWISRQAQEAGYPNAKNSSEVFEYGEGAQVLYIKNDSAVKPESNLQLIQALAAMAEDRGADFYYSTPGVQLIKDSEGSVTGVVGQTSDGFELFNATKAVILATGDYQNNSSMVDRFSPDLSRFARKQVNKTGDGILMSAMAGGHITPVHHSRQMHDFDSGPMPDEPFLCVNENGDRFMDESMPSTSTVNILRFQDAADPGKYSMIFDSNYQTQVTDWGGRPADEAKLRQYVPGEGGGEGVVESLIDTHYADTLDELADKLGIPAANLIASVERYNELAKSGVDVDFGKDQAYLKPIDTPPFWGRHRWIRITATCGGIAVNGNYQVIDSQNEPIPGLYATGFGAGDLCGAADWSIYWAGMSVGSCMNSGRVAALHAITGALEPSHPAEWDEFKETYTASK